MGYMHMSGLAAIIGISGLVILVGIVVVHCFDRVVDCLESLWTPHDDYIP